MVRRLGVGGMRTVYEVAHATLGTRLALKVFTLEKGDVPFLRDRFLTEGRLLARLKHPRLVRVYDLLAPFDPQWRTALSDQSRAICRAYVLENGDARDVARRFGVTPEVVRQVKSRVNRMIAALARRLDG